MSPNARCVGLVAPSTRDQRIIYFASRGGMDIEKDSVSAVLCIVSGTCHRCWRSVFLTVGLLTLEVLLECT